MTVDALDTLRDRLIALRDDALRQLAEADHLDAGMLALIGNVGAALAALDAMKARCRRGGDRAADRRRARDTALRELAPLLAGDLSVERQAHAVVSRLARYRPAQDEASAERRLMRQVVEAGLPLPSAERTRKILVKQKNRLDDQTVPSSFAAGGRNA